MDKFDFSHKDYLRFMERCPFSDEEKSVLNMRRQGKSRIEISMALNLSDRTVDRRIRSIRRKINKEV